MERVRKLPYSPGRARLLQLTFFNINYFLNRNAIISFVENLLRMTVTSIVRQMNSSITKSMILCLFNESILLCGVKKLTHNATATQPAYVQFSSPAVHPSCWQRAACCSFQTLGVPISESCAPHQKKGYVHTSGFANQALWFRNGKGSGRLKLMKACEMSKLNALEKKHDCS